MRRLATLAVVVVSALMSPTVASGQNYTFGDWARDHGYSPGDVMPSHVSAYGGGIDSLDGIGAFDWTTTPTRELDLNFNQISSIESGTFSGLTNLERLVLGWNQLSSIESGAFSGLTNLEWLRLYDNQISSIESGDFSGLTNLEWLDLRNNQIASIESGDFSGLTNLTELHLSLNQISSIEPSNFSGLTNLTVLDLSNNQIASIESGDLSGLTNVQHLFLGCDELSSIESGTFSGLSHLYMLSLNGNSLTELNLAEADFRFLYYFLVSSETITNVSLRNAIVNQRSLGVLMIGTDDTNYDFIGIGDLDGITKMDLSGIDFVDVTDLEPLYLNPGPYGSDEVLDDLTDLWLVNTQNLNASDLDVLLDNLETIEGADTEGILYMTQANFDAFNTNGGGLLAAWNAEPGHHVEYLLLGDVNHDTEVNGLDVDPFVDVLLASRFDVAADMNGDGVVNGLDVDPFVAAVVGGTQQIPEPSTLLLAFVALSVVGGWRKWKRAAYAVCVVLAITSTLVGQTVVVNDNIEFVSIDSDPFTNHVGIVQQNAAGDDQTNVLFDYDGSNLFPEGVLLDQGSDWYVVDPGDPFGFAALASGRFTAIITADFGQTVFVGSNEFYLGVSTTSTNGEGITEPYCSPDEYTCRNVFGWMRLRNVGGQLEMVDNAVAYSSLGIIVGTTDLVPEPSTLTLGALGLVGLLAWRRKSGQRSHV